MKLVNRRVLGALIVLMGVADAQNNKPPAVPGLSGAEKTKAQVRLSSALMKGDATYSVDDRVVSIEWRCSYSTAPLYYHYSTQKESVSFWPTEVACVGVDLIAVGGKNLRTGATVIEVWTLSPPAQTPAPVSEGPITIYPDLVVPVAKSPLYDEAVAGRDMVCRMFQRHGTTNQMYAQFWDSRDVYSFDMVTSSYSLVFSANSGAGVPHVPALSNEYREHRSFRHSAQGFVYVFIPPYSTASADPDPPPLRWTPDLG